LLIEVYNIDDASSLQFLLSNFASCSIKIFVNFIKQIKNKSEAANFNLLNRFKEIFLPFGDLMVIFSHLKNRGHFLPFGVLEEIFYHLKNKRAFSPL
jgi:hypothetical protein